MSKIEYSPPKEGVHNRFGMSEDEYQKRCSEMANDLMANAAQIDYELALMKSQSGIEKGDD